VALALVAAARPASGADGIPADKRALIVLRVLAYDRNLPQRADEVVRLAVIYRFGDRSSESAAEALIASLRGDAGKVMVASRPLRVVGIPYSAQGVEGDLVRAGVAAAIVCPGLGGEVGAISLASRKHSILTFTDDEQMVRAGLSIGVVRRADRAAILVDLVAARAEGADLSADLLRLAEVVRK
jgi:hypothetical protein